MWWLLAPRQTLHLSFRRAVSREESAVALPKADFSPMNRLEMTRAELDVEASGTETDPTFVIPTRGVARGICCGAAKSRFLADESARNDKCGCGCGGFWHRDRPYICHSDARCRARNLLWCCQKQISRR